jgi:hypothetical protein
MSKPSRKVLQLPIEKRAEIAFKVAVAKAIDEHIRLGLPVYIWRNSRVVKLSRTRRVILRDDESRKSYPLRGFVLSTTTLQQAELVLLRAR